MDKIHPDRTLNAACARVLANQPAGEQDVSLSVTVVFELKVAR